MATTRTSPAILVALVLAATCTKGFDREILFPGDDIATRYGVYSFGGLCWFRTTVDGLSIINYISGRLRGSEIRQFSLDFIDDVTANLTSSCTILALIRASPVSWKAGKKHKARVYVSLHEPPTHTLYQRRGTVKLAKDENTNSSRYLAGTGTARIHVLESQQRVYIAIAGPNTTQQVYIDYTLKLRAACSRPLEEAQDLTSEVPVSSAFMGRYSSAIFRLDNARSPEIIVRTLPSSGAKRSSRKITFGASYALNAPPAVWDRKGAILQSSDRWIPFEGEGNLACNSGGHIMYVLVYPTHEMEWGWSSSMEEEKSASGEHSSNNKADGEDGQLQHQHFEVTASWDRPQSLLHPRGTSIKKVCGENGTYIYRANPEVEWLVWVKAVPQSNMDAVKDFLSIMQQGGVTEGVAGAYLQHGDCPTQDNHAICILQNTVVGTDGATLSPPSHMGYEGGSWLLTLQPPLHSCVSYAITVFETQSSTLQQLTYVVFIDYCVVFEIDIPYTKSRGESHLVDEFRVGQKLEAVDFLGHHCVATIAAVDRRYQRVFIHFDGYVQEFESIVVVGTDLRFIPRKYLWVSSYGGEGAGWDGDWDFWTSPDSALVAPVGTTESLELPLDPPRGYLKGDKENFEWSAYLEETSSEAVPVSAFIQKEFFAPTLQGTES
eukprot:jgi/Bigna1/72235/fgenesh1_pg.19_\